MSTEFYWIAVVLTTVVASARITRLLTFDKFPPIKAVRTWYEDKTDGSDWQWLTLCGYCMSPWVTLVVFTLGLVAGVYGDGEQRVGDDAIGFIIWWLVAGWFALSYLAAMTMAHDGDKSEA